MPSAYSQFYVSGSMDIDIRPDYNGKGFCYREFLLVPEAGFYLSEKHALGTELWFESFRDEFEYEVDISTYDEERGEWVPSESRKDTLSLHSRNFALVPFYRWDFLKGERFSLGVKTRASIVFGNGGKKGIDEFDLFLSPVFGFRINSHWSLTASYGRFGFGFTPGYSEGNIRIERSFDGIANCALSDLNFGITYTF